MRFFYRIISITSLVLITTVLNVLCQTYPVSKQDSLINVLIKRHIAIGQAKGTIPGYRIQIYFGTNRNDAIAFKENFERSYKGVKAHLSYQQPNFKIRVGDFRSRLEALKFLSDLDPSYNSAFLVNDEIPLTGN